MKQHPFGAVGDPGIVGGPYPSETKAVALRGLDHSRPQIEIRVCEDGENAGWFLKATKINGKSFSGEKVDRHGIPLKASSTSTLKFCGSPEIGFAFEGQAALARNQLNLRRAIGQISEIRWVGRDGDDLRIDFVKRSESPGWESRREERR